MQIIEHLRYEGEINIGVTLVWSGWCQTHVLIYVQPKGFSFFYIVGELLLHHLLTHLGPKDNKSTRIIDRQTLIVVHIADRRWDLNIRQQRHTAVRWVKHYIKLNVTSLSTNLTVLTYTMMYLKCCFLP